VQPVGCSVYTMQHCANCCANCCLTVYTLQPAAATGCTTTLYNRRVPRPRHAIMTSLTLLPSAVAPFLFVFSGSTVHEDDDDDLFIAATAAAAVDIIIKRRRRRRQRRRLQWKPLSSVFHNTGCCLTASISLLQSASDHNFTEAML